MTTKRILDIVDDQNGFMIHDSDLPVPGAEALIGPTNDFFGKIKAGTFDAAIFKYDTHFADEYSKSPEAKSFPLHCEYGTKGWNLAVDPGLLKDKTAVFHMMKNTFDMWGANPVGKENTLAFKSAAEKDAYRNLYRLVADIAVPSRGIERDTFMDTLKVGPDTEVVMIGVASNFCVYDAMLGYLKRGCKVTVLEDLARGIPLGPQGQKGLLAATGFDRTASGDIRDVLKTDTFGPYVGTGQPKLETSSDFLRRAQGPDPGPARCSFPFLGC